MAVSLFLIGTLHAMIFAFFQLPENFLLGRDSTDLAMICKSILYAFAIGASLFHQILGRKVGLRKALYFGLLCNLLGISTLMVNQFLETRGLVFLIFLDMVVFGIALTSVINSLVTYIILEFPKRVGFGVVALFAFLNLGNMLAPLLSNGFRALNLSSLINPFLIALLLFSLWFVYVYFFDPSVPPHLAHLRKGTLIWKELHYRLGLFVLAIVAYGLAETTFYLWGFIQIKDMLGIVRADEIVPFFWLFLVIGQIILLLPLYFFPPTRIFYVLILMIIGAAFYFPLQTKGTGFVTALIVAGVGCSAVFPILLSMMEKEMLPFARGSHLLHYIEVGISVMIAGYILGVGIIDLWVEKWGSHPLLSPSTHIHLAMLFIGITGLAALFLNLTSPKLK